MENYKPAQNLPNVINDDYESYFMQQRMRYLLSEDWQRVEANFKKELKLHIMPNDFENLESNVNHVFVHSNLRVWWRVCGIKASIVNVVVSMK